jgi:LysM repeat protein
MAALSVLTSGVLMGRAGAGPDEGPGHGGWVVRPPRTHVVRAGETVWSIAVRLAGSEGDPRPVVDRLIDLNHITGAVIVPGQRLLVP